MRVKTIVLLILVSSIFSSVANAATYYVRTDGHDTSSGLANTSDATTGAWLTLQKAANTVSAGDTVLVASGNYAGFWTDCAGTAGNPITFKAIVTGGAVITSANSRTTDGINIEHWSGTANYITVDGFVVGSMTRHGIRAIDGTGIIIKNCQIYSNGDCGIFSGNTPSIQVLDNVSYSNGDTILEHNIYISNAESDNPIIRGNICYSAGGGNGIQLNGDWEQGGDGYIDGAIIEDNIVYSNYSKGFSLISVRNATIQNNVTYDNGGAAAFHIVEQLDSHYSSGNMIVNNTSHETGTVCVRINSGNTGNVVFNNVCVYNGDGIIFEGSGNYESNNREYTAVGTNFRDAANRDYHLAAGSTAINYGGSTYQSKTPPTYDFDGTARATIDAGAFEYVDGDDFFYVSPYGSGSACTLGRPCATVTAGLAVIGAGETLTFADGTYTTSISGVPSGSTGDYTLVRSKNVHGAKIINSGSRTISASSAHHIEFNGFIADGNGAVTEVVYAEYSNHIKFRNIAAYGAQTPAQSNVFDITNSQYCLFEDCWAWGAGRYKFSVYQSEYNIVRRCVARHDYTDPNGVQCAPFNNYDSMDTVWQNNIAIDSDTQYCLGSNGLFGAFFCENKVDYGPDTSQYFYGNIVINVIDDEEYSGGILARASGDWHAQDFLIWGGRSGITIEQGPDVAGNVQLNRFTSGRHTGTYDGNNGAPSSGVGVEIYDNFGTRTLRNSILYDNNSYGIADYVNSDYNVFYGNGANAGGSRTAPSIGANSITDRAPESNGLLYPVRVESGSFLSTAGSGGGKVGAEIMYKIGVTGTLYGETGYLDTTIERLWPWNNQDLIKADMASYNGPGPSGVRGFTAGTSLSGAPQTLTNYIWEQLGNQSPADYYAGWESGAEPTPTPTPTPAPNVNGLTFDGGVVR